MRPTTSASMYTFQHRTPTLSRGASVTVQPWEQAVLVRDGEVLEVLAAGRHRRWAGRTSVHRVDLRPWILHLPTQEVPTADGFTVKVTVTGRVRVVDPVTHVTAARDHHGALHLSAQLAVREVLSGTSVTDLLAGRSDLGDRLTAAVVGADALGVTVERLELKDVILPPEVRRAQAEVVVARAQGLAALERARGETAALRNLANAASLLRDNPALLQLRLVQQLAATTGHTVVLGQAPLVG